MEEELTKSNGDCRDCCKDRWDLRVSCQAGAQAPLGRLIGNIRESFQGL